ncbi:hypothetical protein NDU88_004273 [Pleurodeles waltl]|uniref:Uncharacterized protein n=1 Tax=Pleurodeles waltl TaxID=8319 RepID=A0AAV7SIB5_PLEWA|nr:hypothetical protein NDU88_004273 [Pleurodeles waltl]
MVLVDQHNSCKIRLEVRHHQARCMRATLGKRQEIDSGPVKPEQEDPYAVKVRGLWRSGPPEKGAWPRWRHERTRLYVLRRLGLRHSFGTPVGVHLGGPVIAPGAVDSGVPQRAQGACGGAGQRSGGEWLVPPPAAGRRGLQRCEPRGGPWSWWPAGRERWCGGGPGGRCAAGVWRGLCCAPDVACSAGALRAARPRPLVGETSVPVHCLAARFGCGAALDDAGSWDH